MFAATYPPSPAKSNLCGTWVGHDADAITFYRMQLTTNDGLFASSYPGHAIDQYRITSWSLQESRVSFSLTNQTGNAEPLNIDAIASQSSIELHIRNQRNTWDRDIRLFRENYLYNRMDKLKRSME